MSLAPLCWRLDSPEPAPDINCTVKVLGINCNLAEKQMRLAALIVLCDPDVVTLQVVWKEEHLTCLAYLPYRQFKASASRGRGV